MKNVNVLAAEAIERAKNLQEYAVFRDIEDIVFDSIPLPYTIRHTMGEKVEITVPAIDQEEAETRVDKWLRGQRA